VGFINGKRCLGGMLELMAHCHYLVAPEDAQLGMPEVTLPVVPGMEGCHWPLRKAQAKDRTKLVSMLLTGTPVRAKDAVGWLVDFAGPMPQAMKTAWQVASNGDHGLKRRTVEQKALEAPSAAGVPTARRTRPRARRSWIRSRRRVVRPWIRRSACRPSTPRGS
jgi:enoyl-CoA hydratase/carnithine racemase